MPSCIGHLFRQNSSFHFGESWHAVRHEQAHFTATDLPISLCLGFSIWILVQGLQRFVNLLLDYSLHQIANPLFILWIWGTLCPPFLFCSLCPSWPLASMRDSEQLAYLQYPQRQPLSLALYPWVCLVFFHQHSGFTPNSCGVRYSFIVTSTTQCTLVLPHGDSSCLKSGSFGASLRVNSPLPDDPIEAVVCFVRRLHHKSLKLSTPHVASCHGSSRAGFAS